MRRLALALGAAAATALLLAVAFGGAGFPNYDTVYALVWGREIAEGARPDLETPLAPTPHPLANLAGVLLSPLHALRGSDGAEGEVVQELVTAFGYLVLGVLAWVTFQLGRQWFGAAAGAFAAAVLLTREPLLSYGLRAYVDVPYLALVLGALLVESRRRAAGAPVLGLLTLAGLLRPEAWLFAAAYVPWLWWARGRPALRHLAPPAALAAAAPLLWALGDLLLTGNPLHSLTGTRATADELGRITGLHNVPLTLPRRLGEILREPVLVAAAGGGLLTLAWRRRQALLGAAAGVLAVAAFCVLAAAGLPILTRYLLLPAAILAIFAGAGALGWLQLERDDPRRRPWMAFGALVAVLLVAFLPAQLDRLDRLQRALSVQGEILDDLEALTGRSAARPPVVDLSCPPLTVPNQRPVPHLAYALDVGPGAIRNAQESPPRRGTYVVPSSREVAERFVLDRRDLRRRVEPVPPGFEEVARVGAWRVTRGACAG